MGSFNLIYTPAMFIGWITLPLLLHLFRKNQNVFFSASLVSIHGIIYSFWFVFISVLVLDIPFWTYFISDISFEIALILNGFITTLLLKNKLVKLLKKVAF